MLADMRLARLVAALVGLTVIALAGCTTSSSGEGAIETNVMPAPCNTDADCLGGIQCVILVEDAGGLPRGHCAVDAGR